MYLFVFAWVPSLQEASPTNGALPLGYIFSAFMVSMMLGSLFYTFVTSAAPSQAPTTNLKSGAHADSKLTLHAKLSSLVCALGALALATSVSTDDMRIRFWAFCLFEACVGIYYPVQGMLRGVLVANDHRATVRVSPFSLFFRTITDLRFNSNSNSIRMTIPVFLHSIRSKLV